MFTSAAGGGHAMSFPRCIYDAGTSIGPVLRTLLLLVMTIDLPTSFLRMTFNSITVCPSFMRCSFAESYKTPFTAIVLSAKPMTVDWRFSPPAFLYEITGPTPQTLTLIAEA